MDAGSGAVVKMLREQNNCLFQLNFKKFPGFYNDIAPWMQFKKASNDTAVKHIIKKRTSSYFNLFG
jgi:hypothetical protein